MPFPSPAFPPRPRRPVSAPAPGPPPREPLTTPFHRMSDATRRAFVLGAGLAAVVGSLLAVAWLFPLRVAAGEDASAPPPGMFAHSVFFTLKDRTAEGRESLVAACREHLTGHDGTAYFAAGVRDEGMTRDVNDQNWDVALHLIFRSKDAHDAYQIAPRHRTFIEENKATWATVRVFDATLAAE